MHVRSRISVDTLFLRTGWVVLLFTLAFAGAGCDWFDDDDDDNGGLALVGPIGPPSVENLTCVDIPFAGEVRLEWTLPEDGAGEPQIDLYESLTVIVDGAPQQTLAGDATSALLTGLPFGVEIEVCVEGAAVEGDDPAPTCCPPIVLEELPAVTDLGCVPIGFAGAADLTWALPLDDEGNPRTDLYGEIIVSVDTQAVATLAGSATEFTLDGFEAGTTIDVEITGVFNPFEAAIEATASCAVGLPVLAPVTELTCTPVGFNGAATLSWVNPQPYDEIRVLLDGELVDTLAGDAIDYALAGGTAGETGEVTIEGFVVDGAVLVSTACDVEFLLLPAVDALMCAPVGRFGDAELTWSLPLDGTGAPDLDLYEAIRVTIDGEVVATLDGDAVFYAYSGGTPGTTVLACVDGVVSPDLDDEVVATSCCDLALPTIAPVEDLTCDATGFNGAATITWAIPIDEEYDSLRVLIDDVEVASLDPLATSYDVVGEEPGTSVEVCVEAQTANALATVCCPLDFPELPAVESLECVVAGDVETSIDVTWSIPNVGVDPLYDEIRILIDGGPDPALVLLGTDTGVTLTDFLPGAEVSVCVEGYITDGDRTATACCDPVTIPDPAADVSFVRGDTNQDDRVNVGDAVFIVEYALEIGPDPLCLETVDVDNNGRFDPMADAIFLLNAVFLNSEVIPGPSDCGDDDDNALGCASFPACD